mmetsp:Transcript_1382/g.2721  ORF Transcript_1382/g.2721 Transcript_1382/m.2721 type:complete len:95 (-) Transcript_1382:19-303(-)
MDAPVSLSLDDFFSPQHGGAGGGSPAGPATAAKERRRSPDDVSALVEGLVSIQSPVFDVTRSGYDEKELSAILRSKSAFAVQRRVENVERYVQK